VTRRRLALFLFCLAPFMAVVDTTIVTVALPSMRRALGFSGADAQWILNGYALTFGGLLLFLGRAADLWGRRRLFMVGLAVFAAASLVGGFAVSPGVLIAARFAQGLGAAAFVPASLSLLTDTFAGGEERNRALGIYGAMAAVGFVVGMVGGGVITDLLGWRWVLFVNVPVALAALLPAPAVIREGRDEEDSGALDVPGALTAVLGIASLLYAISEVPDNGWSSPTTIGFALVGVASLAGFVASENRSVAPLVPLAVIRERAVVVPNAAIALQSMVGVAWLYVLTLYFQEVMGRGPLAAGLLFAPMTLISVVAAPVAGRLVTGLGVRTTAASGLALVAAGLLLMTGMSEGGELTLVVCGMVVGEAGFMLSNVALTIAATSGVHEDRRGLASGMMNTSIQFGNAFGLAVVATVAAAVTASLDGGAAAMIGGFRWGLLVCVGFAILALPLVVFGLRGNDPGTKPNARLRGRPRSVGEREG
jgi:EmrB/QacA subfamily drug resistance transporter